MEASGEGTQLHRKWAEQSSVDSGHINMYSPPYSLQRHPRHTHRASRHVELLSFAIDFLVFLGVTLLAYYDVAAGLPTVQRGFFCSDDTLQFPASPSPSSSAAQPLVQQRLQLGFLALALPLAVIVSGEILRSAVNNITVLILRMRVPRFLVDGYRIAGVYLFSLALQEIAVTTTQHLTGRLRPHFRAICQPHLPNGRAACALNNGSFTLSESDDSANGTYSAIRDVTDAVPNSVYVEHYVCVAASAAPELLQAVRHSFPCYAAVIAWSSMSFVVIYLQVRLAAAMWRSLRLLLQFGCLTLATLVSLQCISQNLHHWSDVAAGAIMGVAFAILAAFIVGDPFRGSTARCYFSRDEGCRCSQIATNNCSNFYGMLPRPRKYL